MPNGGRHGLEQPVSGLAFLRVEVNRKCALEPYELFEVIPAYLSALTYVLVLESLHTFGHVMQTLYMLASRTGNSGAVCCACSFLAFVHESSIL